MEQVQVVAKDRYDVSSDPNLANLLSFAIDFIVPRSGLIVGQSMTSDLVDRVSAFAETTLPN